MGFKLGTGYIYKIATAYILVFWEQFLKGLIEGNNWIWLLIPYRLRKTFQAS